MKDYVLAHELDMKQLKKAVEHIGQNLVGITMKMKTIVQIF